MKRFVLFLLTALASSLGAAAYTLNRVSVHDPSIVWEPTTQTYYIFGSFREVAKTSDMMNWTRVATGTDNGTAVGVPWKTNTSDNANSADAFSSPAVTKVTVGGVEKNLPTFDAKAWSAKGGNQGNEAYDITGNLWAPDVIYNTAMEKWCMYMSVNGDNWYSSIVLLTADNIEGPYTYQAPVVISGFTNDNFKDTDLELVIGEQSSLPSRYASPWAATSKPSYPNNIDPCVFYDESGNLWMSYGSWSGGIFMLELDETTGLRDYNVSYSESNASDPYFGKKIAGGYYSSGEASYIEYINGYYYLFLSYGGLQAGGVAGDNNIGGYQMRVFRSASPDGPYTDPMGNSAIFNKYYLNFGDGSGYKAFGENIFGAYGDWGNKTRGIYGERSQGHNSIIAAPDGRTYLVYHTRFQNCFEFHEVRVHQVFQNENGWLVAAPFEYTGETVTNADIASTQQIATADIPGHYKLLVHRNGLDHTKKEIVTPVEIELKSNGAIVGEYTGTWTITSGTSYIQLTLDGQTYKGVMVEQAMEPTNEKVVSFTAMSITSGINIWGHKQADVPEPVYFNDFSSNEGLTQVGSGEFIEDADPRFGIIYHNNPENNKTARTNYLKLPVDVLTHSATTKEMTIGFWVNVKTAISDLDFFHCPVFSAYGSSTPGEDNGIPMFRCSAKGVMQLNANNGSWSDFNKEQNDDIAKRSNGNTESTAWLDDAKWHYYTVTLTSNNGTIYVDGEVMNSWTMDGTTNGQILSGFFTAAAENGYPVVCIGGNQSWNWNDYDAGFGYDDIAIYDRALTAEQISKIISEKLSQNPNLVYFNDFSSTDGLTIVGGNGSFETSSDANFAQYYQNEPNGTTYREHYLTLPSTVFSRINSSSTGLTVGMWVNGTKAHGTSFYWSPLFCAFDQAPANGETEWTMLYGGACGYLRYNLNEYSGGWCDFTGSQNDNPGPDNSNQLSSVWLDDNDWHYYTVTMTNAESGKAIVYVDGEKQQSWTADFRNLFNTISNLSYVCLGGCQYGNFNDIDAAFAFDDFAVYNKALTAEEIAQIIADKNYKQTYAYTVNASYGEKTKTLASSTGDKNANITVAYPRYIQDGSTLYEAAATDNKYSRTFTLSNNHQEEVIPYDAAAIPNVYYYAEAEDVISGATSDLAAASNGKLGGRQNNSSTYTNLVTLPAGAWQIVTSVYVGNSGDHIVNFKVGDEVKWSFTRGASSGWYTASSETIVLSEAATISVAVDGGSATGIDWIYIKSAEPTETVGGTDFSTNYLGASSSGYTLKKGDTKVFSFWNHSNKQDSWNNWIISVKEGTTDVAITRADFFDVALRMHLDSDGNNAADDWALMSTDGGTTKTGVDWPKFAEDMADALVVATVTYDVDGKLSIHAISTGMKNGYKYYVDNVGHVTSTGNLTVNLSVDHSWLELFSVQDFTIELADEGTESSNATVLTENSGKQRNVRLYGRTLFKDGNWNTLCLPFNLGDATAEAGHHFDGTLLEGATVMTLASTVFSGGTLTMTFENANSIEAGKPYIVKWTTTGDDIVNPVFTGVTINDGNPFNITTSYADFCGIYYKLAFNEDTPSCLLLGARNALYYPKSGASVGACRGYFLLNGLTAGDITSARMFFGDDATAIVQPTKESENEETDSWYSLDGRRLAGKPARSGIYVKNGRKVVIP
ncbi:MAG: family 43 glycosylhydrolase [Prevotella sp.]|nr:family 43 glycosylhydrolase [Prevotella sp.]